MEKIHGLEEIFDFYDVFLIDLWGVYHNGSKLTPYAKQALEKIKNSNKLAIFFSNAPRRASVAMESLNKKFGTENNEYHAIVTSGEAAFSYLRTSQFGTNYYFLGDPKDENIIAELTRYKKVLKPNDADFILVTGVTELGSKICEKDLDLIKNLNKRIKIICANPDLCVRSGNVNYACAGLIGKVCEENGLDVLYFGKPHDHIYKHCYDLIGGKNHRILAIGDNLDTDICGANNQSIDSLLITTGNLYYDIMHNDQILLDKLSNMTLSCCSRPTYIAKWFRY